MAEKHRRRCSTSSAAGETNPNHSERPLHAPWGGPESEAWTIKSVGEDVEESEPSYSAGGNAKWCSCLGK